MEQSIIGISDLINKNRGITIPPQITVLRNILNWIWAATNE